MRSANRRRGGPRPPQPPHSEYSTRPPTVPSGPLRPPTAPRGPGRLSGRGVGTGGWEPRAQIHQGGREGSKNSIEERGVRTQSRSRNAFDSSSKKLHVNEKLWHETVYLFSPGETRRHLNISPNLGGRYASFGYPPRGAPTACNAHHTRPGRLRRGWREADGRITDAKVPTKVSEGRLTGRYE